MKTPAWTFSKRALRLCPPGLTIATVAWFLGSQVEETHQCESQKPKGHCPGEEMLSVSAHQL